MIQDEAKIIGDIEIFMPIKETAVRVYKLMFCHLLAFCK